MQGLNLLLERFSQLQVLRVLYRASQPLSGREVERRSGLSNRATMLALEDLVNAHAVIGKREGHIHAYHLNAANYFVTRGLKPAFEAEEAFWTDFGKTVRRHVVPRPMAAVATGPLARDEVPLNWRIQLIMVFKTGRNRIRAFSGMEPLALSLLQRYAVTVDPILLDMNTMHDPQHDVLWRRVEREGILLFGVLP